MADKAVFSSFRRPDPPSRRPARTAPPERLSNSHAVRATTTPVDGEAVVKPLAADDHPVMAWADLSAIKLYSDQLGLTHPAVISLQAQLPGAAPVGLEADTAGIYRPTGFRPAPWSGFSYDQAQPVLTGIAAGARILTARGEVEVERLLPGDAAMTLRGPALLPIAWIGRTTATVPPIRIEPGALGPNIPRRLLHIGPDQDIFIDPTPVAARTLVNGTTIRMSEMMGPDLFHIDVGRAEVLFAEGLALSSSHDAARRI